MMDLQLLYIGDAAQGEQLSTAAAARGACVLRAEKMMEALGMYITLFPNVTIIDAAHDDAEAVYQHLRSVDAEPIVILVDEHVPALWTLRQDVLRAYGVLTASRHSAPSQLIDMAASLANGLPLIAGGHRRTG